MRATAWCSCSLGDLPDAESADLQIEPAEGWEGPLTQLALMFLLARAFSSGCAALTGVEAISNGVPAFRRPKSRNAATTLLLLGLIAITMMMSVIVLAHQMGHPLRRPARARAAADRRRRRAAGRLRAAPGDLPDRRGRLRPASRPGFYFVVAVTGVILVLAANTAFNGFPVLGSILAQDGLLPRGRSARAATGSPTATASCSSR